MLKYLPLTQGEALVLSVPDSKPARDLLHHLREAHNLKSLHPAVVQHPDQDVPCLIGEV